MKHVRSSFNLDREANSLQAGLAIPDNEDEQLTQQQFKDETDINVLLQRFAITGQMPQGVRMPTYGDFTDVGNFQEALEALAGAQDAFMQMPAEVRDRFANDPGRFVDFCSNPNNAEEARRYGLVTEPDAPTDGQQIVAGLKDLKEALNPSTGETSHSPPK